MTTTRSSARFDPFDQVPTRTALARIWAVYRAGVAGLGFGLLAYFVVRAMVDNQYDWRGKHLEVRHHHYAARSAQRVARSGSEQQATSWRSHILTPPLQRLSRWACSLRSFASSRRSSQAPASGATCTATSTGWRHVGRRVPLPGAPCVLRHFAVGVGVKARRSTESTKDNDGEGRRLSVGWHVSGTSPCL